MAAMDAGADIAVQSSHKLAGGLQQTGTIVWKGEKKPRGNGRVQKDLMYQAYREYVTTSPSYHLVASADAAIRALQANGNEAIAQSISMTRRFQEALKARLPDLKIIDGRTVNRLRACVAGLDPIKTTCGLERYHLTGFAVSDELVAKRIVVEKAGLSAITFITTFQLADDAIDATADAMAEILQGHLISGGKTKPRQQTTDPFALDRPVMHPHDVGRIASHVYHDVKLEEAVGKVAAESVEIYPPGIPVVIEGFRVTAPAIRYLTNIRETLLSKDRPASTVVARDTKLQTLRVV
jgi:lysine decarboxylase